MDNRFLRNIPTISESEQEMLRGKRVLIVGCGGLGGYICEFLVRAGVGAVTAADGDSFEETNLNRQMLSLENTLGKNKAIAAAERARQINPNVDFRVFDEFFSADNADKLMADVDLVIDALDSVDARLLLEDECTQRGLILVHGAISGWNAQISVVKPGSGLLRRLYGTAGGSGNKSCICATPALCASIQVAEALKILCGKRAATEGKLLVADLAAMEFDIIEL